MFIPVRRRGPTTIQRCVVLTVLAAAAAIVAGLQFTSAALLPREKTMKIAGFAVGLALGSVALWVQLLRGDG